MPHTAHKQSPATAKPAGRAHAARKRQEPRKPPPRAISLGGLDGHLGYFIRRAQVWVFQDFNRALKDIDISPGVYSVLWVIDANTGLSQAELARTLGIERARLVRVLHRLDRRGLTKRLQSSDDGRTHALRLTPKGQELLQRATTLAAQHETRLIARLGAEPYRTMMNLLHAF